jgi:nucleotide-binding universal stress UspA family protein
MGKVIRMPTNTRILVAVDKSKASRRAVNYVAEMVRGKPAFHVGLLHLELPPRMLEWGGSEDPDIEERVSSERADAYQVMEIDAIKSGHALLKKRQEILTVKKIDVAAQLVQFEEPLDPNNITGHVLETAKERDYGTVVVGRHSFSGLRHLFRHHVSVELVRTGEAVTIWVVE